MHPLIKHTYFGLLRTSGSMRRRRSAQAGRLRILTYHGICRDSEAGEPWIPSYYVTASLFARQMETLRALGGVVHLPDVLGSDAVFGLPADRLSVAVTFDDGARNNLDLASPVMLGLGIRSTIFISTDHVTSGAPFVSDVLRVLRWLNTANRLPSELPAMVRRLIESPSLMKRVPASLIRDEVLRYWTEIPRDLREKVESALGPLNWEEVVELSRSGHWIGAHTASHAILALEECGRRRWEIEESVARVAERTGQRQVPFAYPNGTRADFDESDQEILSALNVPLAVVAYPGANPRTCSRYEVRRSGVDMGTTALILEATVSGFRDFDEGVGAGSSGWGRLRSSWVPGPTADDPHAESCGDLRCQLRGLPEAGAGYNLTEALANRMVRSARYLARSAGKVSRDPGLLLRRLRIHRHRGDRSVDAGNRYTPTDVQRVLHLQPGERVRVRPVEEILRTLNDKGRFQGLGYMPAIMNPYCGRIFTVKKRVDRFFDERDWRMRKLRNVVILEDAFCEPRSDGPEDYAGCARTCYVFWKEAWLERAEGESAAEAQRV